ncbi:hypothetical protein KBI23_20120 [bacterium]|nr:hypothetical protein [bacterium]MBP9806670.1 hypothetical protein [bacterium]
MNSSKRLILIFCTAAFLLAQFWSFAAAATLLESIDTDPCNDICLEDVISVDPFVGGSCGSGRSESTSLTMAGLFVASEQAVFSALFIVALLASFNQSEPAQCLILQEHQRPVICLALRQLIGKQQV